MIVAPRLDPLTQTGVRRHHQREYRSAPSPMADIMRYMEYAAPWLLIIMSVAGFSAFAYVATTRPLTDLESVFLQVVSASTGFLGTFMIGRQSARNAAAEVIKSCAPGFPWTLDCERVLAGGVSKWGSQIKVRRRRREPGGQHRGSLMEMNGLGRPPGCGS